MAAAKNIDMPISAAVAAVLAGKLSVDAAIESLLTRPIKAEEMNGPLADEIRTRRLVVGQQVKKGAKGEPGPACAIIRPNSI